MKLLQFELTGDFGHFRKFYTTSSPLTFSFPPPPTIKGILGTILGLDKTEYLNILSPSRCKVGIRLLSPIKRVRVGYNHINTSDGYWGLKSGRIQIRTELLKDPLYLVSVWIQDEKLMSQLETYLKNHQTFFTVSLGLSEFLADFKWARSIDAEFVDNGEGLIESVIPVNSLEKSHFHLEPGMRYLKERIPIDMSHDRVVSLYQDIMFEAEGHTFTVQASSLWKTSDGNYIYLF